MHVTTSEIILHGGPADGEVRGEVPAGCTIYTRLAKHPEARYRDAGATDADGRRIFQYFPSASAGASA